MDQRAQQEMEMPLQEYSSVPSGHECDICHSLFTSSDVLERHKQHHPHMVPDRKFKCSICSYSTDNSCRIREHLMRHGKVRPHQCTFCKMAFTAAESLKEHLRIHTGEKPFQCGTCGRLFARRTHLRVHERTHTGEKPYICSRCGEGFSRPAYLKNHEETHNGQEPLQELSSVISAYKCDICHSLFASLEAMESHKQSHMD